MRILTVFFFTTLTLVSCKTTETEKPPRLYTIEQFMDVKSIFSAGFSGDESKILIGSNETGIYNVFEMNLATGEKTQLTKSVEESMFPASYFPNDDRVVFTSDKGGNEIDHIFVRHSNGSTNDIITDSTAKANFYGWSHDKKLMYYSSNSRDKRFFDLYRVDVSATPKEANVYPSMMVYENKEGMDPTAISRDNRYIALIKPITTNNSDVYILDTQSGQTKHITAHEGDVDYRPQYFSPDGSKLIYLTNEGSEFMYIAGYDLSSGAKEKLEVAPWDIMYTYLSRNGKYRVVAINNDARTEVKLYNEADGGKLVQLKNVPQGDITGVAISDDVLCEHLKCSPKSVPL
jgi:Tol biopolymer transport system component